MDFLHIAFPISGVATNVLVPPLVSIVISFFASMGGISGAFLLLPFQMSVLNYTAPSISGTSHVLDIVAVPSGIHRYIKEGRTAWPLTLLSAFLVVISAFFAAPAAGSDFTMIDAAGLHSMVVDNAYRLEGGRDREFTIIDARAKEEYEGAHIFSAINIPEKNFEKAIGLLPRDKNALLVVYGNGANIETSKWASKAAAAGYANIVIYAEGFSVWKEKHLPIAPL